MKQSYWLKAALFLVCSVLRQTRIVLSQGPLYASIGILNEVDYVKAKFDCTTNGFTLPRPKSYVEFLILHQNTIQFNKNAHLLPEMQNNNIKQHFYLDLTWDPSKRDGWAWGDGTALKFEGFTRVWPPDLTPWADGHPNPMGTDK